MKNVCNVPNGDEFAVVFKGKVVYLKYCWGNWYEIETNTFPTNYFWDKPYFTYFSSTRLYIDGPNNML